MQLCNTHLDEHVKKISIYSNEYIPAQVSIAHETSDRPWIPGPGGSLYLIEDRICGYIQYGVLVLARTGLAVAMTVDKRKRSKVSAEEKQRAVLPVFALVRASSVCLAVGGHACMNGLPCWWLPVEVSARVLWGGGAYDVARWRQLRFGRVGGRSMRGSRSRAIAQTAHLARADHDQY
ncbi:hypothetical protein BC827DRAFT_634687 [Russula dissimulans]|nr:hypothetical protein BC827DRAFT_634687 [Russula dissimulans]